MSLRAFGRWAGWQAVTAGCLAALVVFIGLIAPRFFFAGDKQNQYLPAARDIGRRLRAGEWLPVIDPNLGRSGNYALDLQYGIFEPTHWLVAIALSYVGNLTVAALLWAAVFLAVLAAGVCALLLRLGVSGAWAAATALGVTTSGYVLFWAAPSWIPALTSLAWVPWWWWSVTAPRMRSIYLLLTAVFTFLICAGGWPATWVIWGALVVGWIVEAFVRRAEPGTVRAMLLHLLASAGGGFVALITVLPLQRAVDFTSRNTAMENDGKLVPNLADILAFASPGHEGGFIAFGKYPESAPLFFGVWFVIVLVWFVPWRRAVLLRPAIVTSAVALVLCTLCTQAPSNLGALRWPIRMVPGVPLFLGVGAVVALAALGVRMTKGRVIGLALSLAAVTLLGWFRRPDNTDWLSAASLMILAAALLVAAMVTLRGRFAGGVALAATVLLAGWAVATHAHAGMADRGTPPHVTEGQLRLDRTPALALYPDKYRPPGWFYQGVAPGFLRLTETQRTQPGYSSIGQKGWDDRFCVYHAHAYTCANSAEQVNNVEPQTGKTWADLLGYQDIAVYDGKHLDRWRVGIKTSGQSHVWKQTARTKSFVKFSRVHPLDDPGRVTATIGNASVEPLSIHNESQTYKVSSTDGARLVFRDLYWPGYSATLDGSPLKVSSLDKMLVTVSLPPGSSGTLVVSYSPLPTVLLVMPVVVGLLLVALAVALSLLTRPTGRWAQRRRNASPRS